MSGAAEQFLADVDAVFAALAHASRRHILLVLHYRGGEMTAGEIAARFDCTWPWQLKVGRIWMSGEGNIRTFFPRGSSR